MIGKCIRFKVEILSISEKKYDAFLRKGNFKYGGVPKFIGIHASDIRKITKEFNTIF